MVLNQPDGVELRANKPAVVLLFLEVRKKKKIKRLLAGHQIVLDKIIEKFSEISDFCVLVRVCSCFCVSACACACMRLCFFVRVCVCLCVCVFARDYACVHVNA